MPARTDGLNSTALSLTRRRRHVGPKTENLLLQPGFSSAFRRAGFPARHCRATGNRQAGKPALQMVLPLEGLVAVLRPKTQDPGPEKEGSPGQPRRNNLHPSPET